MVIRHIMIFGFIASGSILLSCGHSSSSVQLSNDYDAVVGKWDLRVIRQFLKYRVEERHHCTSPNNSIGSEWVSLRLVDMRPLAWYRIGASDTEFRDDGLWWVRAVDSAGRAFEEILHLYRPGGSGGWWVDDAALTHSTPALDGRKCIQGRATLDDVFEIASSWYIPARRWRSVTGGFVHPSMDEEPFDWIPLSGLVEPNVRILSSGIVAENWIEIFGMLPNLERARSADDE